MPPPGATKFGCQEPGRAGNGHSHVSPSAAPADQATRRRRATDPIPEVREKRIDDGLRELCRPSAALQTWMDEMCKFFTAPTGGESDWDREKDVFLQLKSGIRMEDLRFEYAAHERLRPVLLERPRFTAECLHKVWDVVECPMRMLMHEDEEESEMCCLVNATQVLTGFALLAAGGRPPNSEEERINPMMINHTHASDEATQKSKTSVERRLALQKWFLENRILYVLNLAKEDSDMGEYPFPPTTRVEYLETTHGEGDDFDVPDDSDSDERVRVLSLPMKDKDDYPFATCPHLAAAGRFIERAWRRHKKQLAASVLRQLPGGGDQSAEDKKRAAEEKKPPMIVIHCFGGINRSPAVLIYWLYRYAFNSKVHNFDVMWKRVHQKRTHVFRSYMAANNDCLSPVLHNKEDCWIKQIKERVDKERSRDKYKDLRHPFNRIGFQQTCKLALGRGEPADGRHLSVVTIDCGGVPGSPFSDCGDPDSQPMDLDMS